MFGPTDGEGWRKLDYDIDPQPWFVSMSVLPDYEAMAQPSTQKCGWCVAMEKGATAHKSNYGVRRS